MNDSARPRHFRRTKLVGSTTKIRCARSATKHRISRKRSRYVIEHCESWLELDPPVGGADSSDVRRLYLGDDASGVALEVMAVEREDNSLYVIHAMELRAKFAKDYEEAKGATKCRG